MSAKEKSLLVTGEERIGSKICVRRWEQWTDSSIEEEKEAWKERGGRESQAAWRDRFSAFGEWHRRESASHERRQKKKT